MLKFKQVNVNPKGKKTGDCSTRALAYCLGISWDDALTLQYKMALKTKYDPTSHQVVERILAEHGWVKQKQPRKYDGRKYTVREMDQVVNDYWLSNRCICTVAHHYVVLEDDHYVDTWNSGGKTVGNYFVKD